MLNISILSFQVSLPIPFESFVSADPPSCSSVFDYMSPLVSTDEISMEDMITGDETRLRMLLERTKERYPVSNNIA